MQIKLRGIVLNYIKYRDTSIIVRIYTQEKGLQSYIVNGVRSKSQAKKSRIALYQPLTILDLVAYYRKDKTLHRISEVKGAAPYQSLPYHFKKSGIGMFIGELLSKLLREEEENEDLYKFIESSLTTLDVMDKEYENFHIQFFLKLTRFLGFLPSSVREIRHQILDASKKHQVNTTGLQLEIEIDHLVDQDYTQYMPMNRQKRQALMEIMLHYYNLHVDNLGEIKSLKILKEIMS